MISRITALFKNNPAFVAYLTAGDGGISRSHEAALALIKGGVNLLEIGIPFSDPVADGPVIQQASERALQQKTSLDDVLILVKSIRQSSDVPIILFSYYNPILQGMQRSFLKAAKAAGADACLVVDLPLEESDVYYNACIEAELDPIYIVSASTSKQRINAINNKAKGMLYYACRKGVTGVKSDLPDSFPDQLAAIRSVTTLPVIAGFGIANRDMAQQVMQHADGFVVGSYFVNAIAQGLNADQLTALAESINPFTSKKQVAI